MLHRIRDPGVVARVKVAQQRVLQQWDQLRPQRLEGHVRLVMVGDAAFRREPDDQGLAMWGAFVLMVEPESADSPGGRCNVLDF